MDLDCCVFVFSNYFTINFMNNIKIHRLVTCNNANFCFTSLLSNCYNSAVSWSLLYVLGEIVIQSDVCMWWYVLCFNMFNLLKIRTNTVHLLLSLLLLCFLPICVSLPQIDFNHEYLCCMWNPVWCLCCKIHLIVTMHCSLSAKYWTN